MTKSRGDTRERIYEAVRSIPKGHVATYGQIAAMAGNPRMYRAVGNALHNNPDPSTIPCHRVVNAKGELSKAFAFGGKEKQEELLNSEGVEVVRGKVNLLKFGIGKVSSENELKKTIHVVAAVIRDGSRIFATQRGYGDFKDYWEFPGGKVEDGETSQEALKREIKEELDTVIEVGPFIMTVDYEYPDFHLNMDCFWATVLEGDLILKEHEAARWLSVSELESVNWLPADFSLIELIRNNIKNATQDINTRYNDR